MSITVTNYNFRKWGDYFKNKVNVRKLMVNEDWNEFFDGVDLDSIDGELTKSMKISDILPRPALVFYPFNFLSPKDIKVVILGQDPYPNNDSVPDSMGLSFSVPVGKAIPKSLNNIFENMMKFNHINKKPTHGCLTKWIEQGVFLINTTFTVFPGKSNSHQAIWEDFSESLLNYISNDEMIYLVWGSNAINTTKNIKGTKIISSHPSPFSFDKKCGPHPPFNSVDHFGLVNKRLLEQGAKPIDWEL